MQRDKTIARLVLIRDRNAQKMNLRTKKRKKRVGTKENALIYARTRNAWRENYHEHPKRNHYHLESSTLSQTKRTPQLHHSHYCQIS